MKPKDLMRKFIKTEFLTGLVVSVHEAEPHFLNPDCYSYFWVRTRAGALHIVRTDEIVEVSGEEYDNTHDCEEESQENVQGRNQPVPI